MKLLTKFVFAFTTIVVLMGLFQFVYFQHQIKTEFQHFLMNQESGMIDNLAFYFENYYQNNGSFEGVEQALQPPQFGMGNGRRHPQMMGMQMFNIQIVIANQKRIIIADSKEKYIGEQARDLLGIHRNLIVNGESIGELIIIRENEQNLVKQFIRSTNITILLGTLIGSIIAIFVGFFIAKRITKPVTNLIEGIQKISTGDTAFRVKVKAKDEFYQLAEAFNQMAEQLEHNEKTRKNLMADVAHELRTPLAIIRGKLESIQEGVIEADEKEIMLLVDEVYRLSRLVHDLQQLSLAEAGKLPLHKQQMNINDFLEKVITNFALFANEKNINLKLIRSSKELFLFIDEDRMTQVIVNVLDNALRHTSPDGMISIKVDEDCEAKEVMITISDTGSGIPPELLATIFDRFSRVDSSRNREFGGTGLGLSIAKSFIEAHDGNVSVTSERGKGTSFYIRLPLNHLSVKD